MNDILRFLSDALKSGDDAAFIRIVGHRGSTPRTTGARMVITRRGRVCGTIGGGMVDGAAHQGAAKAFETGRSLLVNLDMPAGDAASAGMICGGEVSFLCEYIPSDDIEAVRFFEQVETSVEASVETSGAKHRKQVLCTEFDASEDSWTTCRRHLIDSSKPMDLAFPDAPLLQNRFPAADAVNGSAFVAAGKRAYCLDVMELRQALFIFGAGHVAKEVSDLALRVGFQSIVVDDREEFANEIRFPPPAAVVLLDAFENGMQALSVDENSYVVIVTRGHLHDRVVLAQALKTRARYIGMIGSRRKRDSIYAALRQDGFTDRDIQRVHSPIGVPIKTETPEEIAVSIVAELIDCRSKQKKNG